jgi:hypothetical protein
LAQGEICPYIDTAAQAYSIANPNSPNMQSAAKGLIFSFSSFPSGGCLVRAIGSQHSLRQKKKNVVISEFLDQIELFYRSDF